MKKLDASKENYIDGMDFWKYFTKAEIKEHLEGVEEIYNDDFIDDYIVDLVEDVENIRDLSPLIECHLDWQGIIREVKMDFHEIDIKGTTWWARG